MKLTQLIRAWEILHVKGTGEMGLCDLCDALEESGVKIENDVIKCKLVKPGPDKQHSKAIHTGMLFEHLIVKTTAGN